MTRLNAFGYGLAGVFSSFIGIGTIPTLFWYFENFSQIIGYTSYGESTMFIAIFVFPAIILAIGSTLFYYGIKIIQQNK